MDDSSSHSDSNVKVAVRVRPLNRREKDLNTKCVVEMEGNQTVLHPAIANANKGDPRIPEKMSASTVDTRSSVLRYIFVLLQRQEQKGSCLKENK